MIEYPENNEADLLWRHVSELPYFRAFLRAIEGRFYEKVAIETPALDLGCGDGHFAARSLPHQELVGVDPAFRSILAAGQYCYYTGLICCAGGSLPFATRTHQTVISNSVLEHISGVDEVLLEIHRVLQPGGKLIITVPNQNFTENLSLAMFFDSLGLSGMAGGYRRWFNKISRHHHTYPTQEWVRKLEEVGFSVVEVFQYFSPEYLRILEWGHYLGLPWLLWKKTIGRWTLYPSWNNLLLRWIYSWLNRYYQKDPKSENGAYTFIHAVKQNG